MAERYESAATIVTSNLDLTEWDQAFSANKLLASATLDRMRHNAYCLVLDGKSYRAPMVPFTLFRAGSNMPKTGGSIAPEGDNRRQVQLLFIDLELGHVGHPLLI